MLAQPLFSSKMCFWMPKQIIKKEGALEYGGFHKIRSSLYRARHIEYPPIPNSLEMFSQLIIDLRYNNRFGLSIGHNPGFFFNGHLIADDGTNISIVLSPTIANYARNNVNPLELYADATFRVVPRLFGAIQLFCIHILINNKTFPLVYCLMERKTRSAYLTIFQRLIELIPNIQICRIFYV